VKLGGEGLALHRGSSLYRAGRTGDLMKFKPYEDAEARVVAYVPGKGKYAGVLGALLVEMPDGTRFRIGTGFSDEQRRHPPSLGSFVTYRYQGVTTGGKPRFARFMRIREAM
jgi:DNA ligase 1